MCTHARRRFFPRNGLRRHASGVPKGQKQGLGSIACPVSHCIALIPQRDPRNLFSLEERKIGEGSKIVLVGGRLVFRLSSHDCKDQNISLCNPLFGTRRGLQNLAFLIHITEIHGGVGLRAASLLYYLSHNIPFATYILMPAEPP